MRTSQLQIRVTPDEKTTLKRLAGSAGVSVSAYVLSQVLPSTHIVFARLVTELRTGSVDRKTVLAELRRLLSEQPPEEFSGGVAHPDLDGLSPVLRNYLTAMVEQAALEKGVDPPAWVADVPRLERPHFAWALHSLRPYQVKVAPVAFKRRNIFFDPSGGVRV